MGGGAEPRDVGGVLEAAKRAAVSSPSSGPRTSGRIAVTMPRGGRQSKVGFFVQPPR